MRISARQAALTIAARLTVLLTAFLSLSVTPVHACPGPDEPCRIADREYFVAKPSKARLDGMVVFLHGYGRSGADVIRHQAIVEAAEAVGLLLVAPTGQPSAEQAANDWRVRDGQPGFEDDVSFLAAVVKDVRERHGIDPERTFLAGFSRGGSMVWDIACHAPGGYRAFASASGAFWHPMPKSCDGPQRLFHTHGWVDGTVPIEGRAIPKANLRQGDLFAGLDIWKTTNGCPSVPAVRKVDARTWRREWTGCKAGALRLDLHGGGHVIPDWWPRAALSWFAGMSSIPTSQTERLR